MTKLHELAEIGQAVWLDYIRRSFLTTGELAKLIDLGLRGMTSNPTIFEKAIVHSADYDEDLGRLVQSAAPMHEIYDELVGADIRQAADLFRPVYDATKGRDGYVSLEVSPLLANDTAETVAEARRLWALIDRPNLMIKIPATLEGLPAITAATAEGINVNVTLIFSLQRYGEVMAAYLKGLEQRAAAGKPLYHIHSVASFFVSRVDTKVDKRLQGIIDQGGASAELAQNLLGQAAVANARLAYRQFETVFIGDGSGGSSQFAELKKRGANLQRPLWASTSTKNPQYSDIKYIQELIAPYTINTMPQETLEAFLDHGEARFSLDEFQKEIDQANWVMQSLRDLGISMEEVTRELELEGVESFAQSFRSMEAGLMEKRQALQPQWQPMAAGVGSYQNAGNLPPVLDEFAADRVMERLWAGDHTLWKPDPEEITNRLGWLRSAETTDLEPVRRLVEAVRNAGYTQGLLLGMGGSSLAPELFARIFGPDHQGLNLSVLDSTDPDAVLAAAERIDPNRTLFIVSTKSGTTEETLSFFKFFYNRTAAALGREKAGEHFVAITDPGSKLETLAREHGFRAVFANDPNIGGRYSALSYFGLVPAALVGVDLDRLLASARRMAAWCGPDVPPENNPAAQLGAILGELWRGGRDKLTFVLSPELAAFGDWVEQLIAESTGKEGKGILPVVGEPLGPPAVYGDDRLFVEIKLSGSEGGGYPLRLLEENRFPVVRLGIQDRYRLGGQFLLWELATALAGMRMGINPFDQPNVEAAKVRARQMVNAYKESGSLPQEPPLQSADGIEVYGSLAGGIETQPNTPAEALVDFLSQAGPGDYIALQAFLQPAGATDEALQDLRLRLRDEYRLATTLGYGPRFLHSTGQLHKGDAGKGLFIQFTSPGERRADIPDAPGEEASSIDFGVLKLAQALGDFQALRDAGRRVIRFHIVVDSAQGIRRLAQVLEPHETAGD